MQIYSFFNSSTSYRVRIALALKGLAADYKGVNIRKDEHHRAGYVTQVNPSATVPALVDGELSLGQSMAIIDYLDQRYPEPRLIPQDILLRARVLEFSNLIACDIHPVNNLRILRYLQDTLQATPEQKDAWYRHWIAQGFAVMERLLQMHGTGHWCFGDQPTLADVCLVPQVANAQRMGCTLAPYAKVLGVFGHASQHPAFIAAEPTRQPDYQP